MSVSDPSLKAQGQRPSPDETAQSRVGAPSGTKGPRRLEGQRRWYLWLGLLAMAGTVIPVISILRATHEYASGDALYFHKQAQLIANGSGWFIDPYTFIHEHQKVLPGAAHPPLWTLLLVVANELGLRSYSSQLLFACVLGGVAVFVTGLAAREAAGTRAGLIAGAIAAIYPNYWINYGQGLGETPLLLIIAAVLLMSMKLWRRPSYPKAAALGLLCALAALTRAEQILLVPLVIVPTALTIPGIAFRRRLAYAGLGVVIVVITLTPWVAFNMTRFVHPTFMSTDSGSTLAEANCYPAYPRTAHRLRRLRVPQRVQDRSR